MFDTYQATTTVGEVKQTAELSTEKARHVAQTAQATAQVPTILNGIRKATGTAVLATEQGDKAVAPGVKLSAQADRGRGQKTA